MTHSAADSGALGALVTDAVWILDAEGRIVYQNPSGETLTGRGADALRGVPAAEVLRFVDETLRTPLADPVQQCLRLRRPVSILAGTLLLRPDGRREFPVTGTVAPLAAGAAVVLNDVTELTGLRQVVAFQAVHDPLTGLLNRRELDIRLRRSIAEAHAAAAALSLLSIEVDAYTAVDQIGGYPAGDALLETAADLIQGALRSTDSVARVRGPQFAALLDGCGLEAATRLAESLRAAAAARRFAWETHTFEPTLSIGVASLDGRVDSEVELHMQAASARYIAVQQGGNRVHVFTADDEALGAQRALLRWRQRIREAVEASRFQIYVQPIVPLQPELPRRGELLVRMLDEADGPIAPASFLAAAERYSLMPALDRWVVSRALELIGTGELDRQAQPPIEVYGINVSGQSLSDPAFQTHVLAELDRTGVPGHRICFEVTETAAIEEMDRARAFLAAVRERGSGLALDDFGTGLSSFAYLQALAVNTVKIDGSFVRGLPDDPSDRALVESITRMGHTLGVSVIAEYVETPAILEEVRRLGVDYAQGTAVGEPQAVGPATAG